MVAPVQQARWDTCLRRKKLWNKMSMWIGSFLVHPQEGHMPGLYWVNACLVIKVKYWESALMNRKNGSKFVSLHWHPMPVKSLGSESTLHVMMFSQTKNIAKQVTAF